MRYLPLVLLLLLAGCPKPQPSASPSAGFQPQGAVQPPARINADGGGAAVSVLCEPGILPALEQLKPQLEQRGNIKLTFTAKDSLALAAEAKQGALAKAADVFIYIGLPEVETGLREGKATDDATARTFAGDRLCIASRHGEDWGVPTLFDIYKLRFKLLGLPPEQSAVGQCAVAALKTDGVYKRITKRLRFLDSLNELPKSIQREECQLVLTLASAVVQDKDLAVAVLIDPGLHEDIRYRAVAAAGKGAGVGVMALLRLLAEDGTTQQSLAGFGYTDRNNALIEVR